MKRQSSGYVVSIVVTAISVVIALFVIFNRQTIVDQYSVWQYTPNEEIAAFADRTGLNEKGKFLLYASQPSLDDSQSFNTNCSRVEKSTAILGCYDGARIYIYDVTNDRLDGIREVTAAHEMLHAAYLRLDEKKRTEVNALLEQEYEKLKDIPEFAERMDFYARTEPGERSNELHSIIATEVAIIDPALETYFKTYFSSRSKTVALHGQYASVFASLQSRALELSQQLTNLADIIDAETATYNSDVAVLNRDIELFKKKATNQEFSSQAELNRELELLSSRAAELDSRVTQIQTNRERYNGLREELILVSGESEALNRSIDSSAAPAPSI